MNATCIDCGATVLDGARFCRQCGRPLTATVEPPAVTDATTRLLEATRSREEFAPFAETSASPVARYGANTTAPQSAHAPATTSLVAPKNRRNIFWMFPILAFIVVAAIAATVLFVTPLYKYNSAHETSVITIPEVPHPPAAPVPDEQSGTGEASDELIYPNAKVEMKVGDPDGGEAVLQMSTNDSFKDVVQWYKENHDMHTVNLISNNNAILSDATTTIVITAEGKATHIIVTQGNDER